VYSCCCWPLLEAVDWEEEGVAVTKGGDKVSADVVGVPDGSNIRAAASSSSMSSSSAGPGEPHSGAPKAAAAATFVLSWKYTKFEEND
jgi:hypothetical protein